MKPLSQFVIALIAACRMNICAITVNVGVVGAQAITHISGVIITPGVGRQVTVMRMHTNIWCCVCLACINTLITSGIAFTRTHILRELSPGGA